MALLRAAAARAAATSRPDDVRGGARAPARARRARERSSGSHEIDAVAARRRRAAGLDVHERAADGARRGRWRGAGAPTGIAAAPARARRPGARAVARGRRPRVRRSPAPRAGDRRAGRARRAARHSATLGFLRERMRARAHRDGRRRGRRRGRSRPAAHQPVGGVTEVVGVGTLPAARRRGLGARGHRPRWSRTRASAAPRSSSCRPAARTSRASTAASASSASAPPASSALMRRGDERGRRPSTPWRATRGSERPRGRRACGRADDRVLGDPREARRRRAATAAIFRCAYALPVLGLLAWLEHRRYGAARARASGGSRSPPACCFAADLIFWHHAIADVGAGLATVLGNLQVVIVPFVALARAGRARSARASSPRCRSCAPASC